MIGILCIGLLVSSSLAQQETNPPISINRDFTCYNTDKLVSELLTTHKESPFVVGRSDDQAGTTMSLWVSVATKTWTIIATNGEVSCVIGTGTGLKLMPVGKGISI
jgi:hypothetical protein